MFKLILFLVLAVLAFCGALAGALAASGNLSKEGVDKLLGKVPPKSESKAATTDDLDPLARALKEREEELAKREAAVKDKEERLKTAQQDLESLRGTVAQLLKDMDASVGATDEASKKRRQEVVEFLSSMKPKDAADVLAAKEPKDAVALLREMPEKDRSKIMEQIPPEKMGAVLDALQEP